MIEPNILLFDKIKASNSKNWIGNLISDLMSTMNEKANSNILNLNYQHSLFAWSIITMSPYIISSLKVCHGYGVIVRTTQTKVIIVYAMGFSMINRGG